MNHTFRSAITHHPSKGMALAQNARSGATVQGLDETQNNVRDIGSSALRLRVAE
jgi:hypothetical protein